MNNKTAKKLRKIIQPNDPVSRRVYQRLKKQYTKLSANAKPVFLDQISKMLNAATQEQLDQ